MLYVQKVIVLLLNWRKCETEENKLYVELHYVQFLIESRLLVQKLQKYTTIQKRKKKLNRIQFYLLYIHIFLDKFLFYYFLNLVVKVLSLVLSCKI